MKTREHRLARLVALEQRRVQQAERALAEAQRATSEAHASADRARADVLAAHLAPDETTTATDLATGDAWRTSLEKKYAAAERVVQTRADEQRMAERALLVQKRASLQLEILLEAERRIVMARLRSVTRRAEDESASRRRTAR